MAFTAEPAVRLRQISPAKVRLDIVRIVIGLPPEPLLIAVTRRNVRFAFRNTRELLPDYV